VFSNWVLVGAEVKEIASRLISMFVLDV